MTGVSLERLADTLYPKPEPKNSTAYGTVESINPDGSYQVKLNASATTTRCAKLCDAEVTDRVLVLIQANGHCAAIGRVGGSIGSSPTVLYDNPLGNNGNVTLSESAANFDYIRVYFFVQRDSDKNYAATDVYEPNGKGVSLLAVRNATSGSRFNYSGATYLISGTGMTRVSTGSADSGGGLSGDADTYIYHVEAWNLPPAMIGSRGGGGDAHTYALSGSGVTISLTEDGMSAAGSYTIPEMTAAEASTGTSTAPRVISAKVLNDLIDEKMPAAVQSGSNLAVE